LLWALTLADAADARRGQRLGGGRAGHSRGSADPARAAVSAWCRLSIASHRVGFGSGAGDQGREPARPSRAQAPPPPPAPPPQPSRAAPELSSSPRRAADTDVEGPDGARCGTSPLILYDGLVAGVREAVRETADRIGLRP